MKTLHLLVVLALSSSSVLAGIESTEAHDSGNYATSVAEIRPLAEKGDAKAQFSLGYMYENGQGVPQDFKQAMNWYAKAADQGNPEAQFTLGRMYDQRPIRIKSSKEDTRLVLEREIALARAIHRDAKQAVTWYLKAAEQGNADAQISLAEMYGGGDGVSQDQKQATAWYLKAAEQGNVEAQYHIGLHYSIKNDYQQAMSWYIKAAEQGDARAQESLGYMYEHGLGVPLDFKRAMSWYEKAVDQGSQEAQLRLGGMYYKGQVQGSPQDYKRAMNWLLFNAAQIGDILKVEDVLSRGADVNAKAPDGTTPLMYAVQSDLEITKYLVDKGADVNAKGPDGETPLMFAIQGWNHFDGPEVFFKEMRAKRGRELPQIIKLLIDNGVDINAKSTRGETALSIAESMIKKDIVRLLRKAGAQDG